MQACAQCGKHNPDENRFCAHCGYRLNNRCPDCGFDNLPNQAFCGSCGKQLLEDSTLTERQLHWTPEAAAPQQVAETAEESVVDVPSLTSPQPVQTMEKPPAEIPPGEPPGEAPLEPAYTPAAGPLEGGPGETGEGEFPLAEYAVVSLEFSTPTPAELQENDVLPEQLERFRNDCVEYVGKHLKQAADVRISENRVIHGAFQHAPSVDQSLMSAIDLCLQLIARPFALGSIQLGLKAGVAIDNIHHPGPDVSGLERSVARKGMAVISAEAYKLVGDRYQAEKIGPLPIAERSVTFYRVLSKPQAQAAPVAAVSPRTEEAEEPVQIPAGAGEEPVPEQAAEPVSDIATITYEAPKLHAIQAARKPNATWYQAAEALTGVFQEALAGSPDARGPANGRVLALCGSDGLGKSAIINKARTSTDPGADRAYYFIAQSYRSFQESRIPLLPWLEFYQNLLGLMLEGHSRQEVRATVEAFLKHFYGDTVPEDKLGFLCDFLCVNPPEPISAESSFFAGRFADVTMELLSLASREKPVIIVLDDLQYTDTASLSVLEALLKRGLLKLPVTLILIHSADFYLSGDLQNTLRHGPYQEVVISDLAPEEVERMMNEGPLGGQSVQFPVSFLDAMGVNAKGKAIYIEEMLRLLHLKGGLSLDPDTNKCVVEDESILTGFDTDQPVESLTAQRVAILSDEARYLLQVASVLGERFPLNHLMNAAQMEAGEFQEQLEYLYHHGFVMPDPVNTCRFRHGRIWRAVYDTVPHDLKQEIHQLISEALERDYRQGLTVTPAILAYHAERAGLPRREFASRSLVGFHAVQAGVLRGANEALFDALDMFSQAANAGALAEERGMIVQLQESLGILNREENPELAIRLLEAGISHYRRTGDTARLLELYGTLASCHEMLGHYPAAVESIDEALALLSGDELVVERAVMTTSKVELLYTLGKLGEAKALIGTDISPAFPELSAVENNPDYLNAWLSMKLIESQVLLDCYDSRGFEVIEEVMPVLERHAVEGMDIAFKLVAGRGFVRKGMYEECDQEADALLDQIESLGQPDWFLAQWGLLALTYHCALGDWQNAGQILMTVLAKAGDVKDYLTQTLAHTYAGYLLYKSENKPIEARKTIEDALTESANRRLAAPALLGWRYLAGLELDLGNYKVAVEIAENALNVAKKPEMAQRGEEYRLTIVLARALLASGEIKKAGSLLEGLWPKAIDTRFSPLVAETAMAIGELYRQMAADAPSDVSKKHLVKSIQFYQKAQGIWLELKNSYRINQVRESTPKI